MKIEDHWAEIVRVVMRGQRSSLHCAIASVGADGTPNITPIGTIFLRSDCTGFYFDQYTSSLAKNIETNSNVCLMAVNTSSFFWFRSFLFGRFISPPGVRLYGEVSALRLATAEELAAIERRIRPTRWLRGSRILWSSFTHVRDVRFTTFRPVTYPAMMEHLWA